jgi:hypothetical protein
MLPQIRNLDFAPVTLGEKKAVAPAGITKKLPSA